VGIGSSTNFDRNLFTLVIPAKHPPSSIPGRNKLQAPEIVHRLHGLYRLRIILCGQGVYTEKNACDKWPWREVNNRGQNNKRAGRKSGREHTSVIIATINECTGETRVIHEKPRLRLDIVGLWDSRR
jgi:hypothetical protein